MVLVVFSATGVYVQSPVWAQNRHRSRHSIRIKLFGGPLASGVQSLIADWSLNRDRL